MVEVPNQVSVARVRQVRMEAMRNMLLAFVCWGCCWACGGANAGAPSGNAGGTDPAGGTGSASQGNGGVGAGAGTGSIGGAPRELGGGGATGSSGAASGGGGAKQSPVGTERFRYGFNGGYPNPAFTDVDLGLLARKAGATSERVSLPMTHLVKWGYTIEVNDIKANSAAGMGSLIGFLTQPTKDISTAPTTAADWELAYYIPQNLYEPAVKDGKINPGNPWANYVYQTVTTYHDAIKVWEIWNEPDWVASYKTAERWGTVPPQKTELPRFNGSIFDYVRMLRVSKEAALLADPEAKIATGGLGYSTFLDAIFRYTDEPSAGSITADFPATGKAYVDVVSFHYYPIYAAGNSDIGVAGFLAQKEAMAAVVAKAGASVGWECTETGAPHLGIDKYPGGEGYARNYLMKAMLLAPTVGLSGLHWFVLSDGAESGASSDPYDFMGLYAPVGKLTSPKEAVLNGAGRAYLTLTTLFDHATFDPSATQLLIDQLPKSARAVAYLGEDKKARWALWATATGQTEADELPVVLKSSTAFTRYAFDALSSGLKSTLTPQGNQISLTLTGEPALLVEE